MTHPVGNHRVTAPPPLSPSPASHSPAHPSLPTKSRDTPQGKNLRWTAVALVNKLSQERELLSSAVADDIALAASNDLLRAHPNRDAAAIERNTRRRVYDALKVMVAAGCVQKEGKALRWIGVDDLRRASCNAPNLKQTAVRVAICKSRRSIAQKRGDLHDIQMRVAAFQRFLSQRQGDFSDTAQSYDDRLQFPFILVKAKDPNISFTPGKRRVRIDTHSEFKLYSETDLVCLMADRRKSRFCARRPRPTKKARRQLGRKLPSEALSPPTPPPPPPPSPTKFKLDSVRIVPATTLRREGQLKFVDLALNTISKPLKSEECAETFDSANQVEQDCDLDILDTLKTENYLDSGLPIRYTKEEDEEVLFLEDIGEKEKTPKHTYMQDIYQPAQNSRTSSSSSKEPDSHFDQLLRKEAEKQEFVQDVSMICEEHLAIAPHTEEIDCEDVLIEVIDDINNPLAKDSSMNEDGTKPLDQPKSSS